MSVIETCFLLIRCEQHLCHHHLRQTVLMHTARSLVHKNIVKYLREAVSTVPEWDRRVEAEKGEVEVATRLVIRGHD